MASGRRLRGRASARRQARIGSRATKLAVGVLVLILGAAFLGPYVAPHSTSALVGIPYSTPDGEFYLGTDYLGEDVFSRVLGGGRAVILFSAAATGLGYLVGGLIGLTAGFRRSWPDAVLMRTMDVLLAFPPILFLLLVATGAGANVTALVIAIAVIHVPSIARIVRTAAAEVAVRGYVEAAIARGDSTLVILRREILPNVWPAVAADAGPRFTVSILLVAAVNFVGVGLAPPAADWALMISENRAGIGINPWAVVSPAVMIGALTVSVNIIADALAGSLGRSTRPEVIPR
jgi:ABC-type dipeptide/oligopeptide/nickel transport system permease subunit